MTVHEKLNRQPDIIFFRMNYWVLEDFELGLLFIRGIRMPPIKVSLTTPLPIGSQPEKGIFFKESVYTAFFWYFGAAPVAAENRRAG